MELKLELYLWVMWFACAFFSAFVAREKNRNASAWFVLGLLFGIIALIAVVGIPALEKPNEKENDEVPDEPTYLKVGEEVITDAPEWK